MIAPLPQELGEQMQAHGAPIAAGRGQLPLGSRLSKPSTIQHAFRQRHAAQREELFVGKSQLIVDTPSCAELAICNHTPNQHK